MSKFDFLQQQLSDYQNLQYHQDQQLADKLQQVQVWQKDRMQRTHADFFAKAEHQPMAHYFLNRLYGADDFDELARQIDRFIRNAHKVEKFIPKFYKGYRKFWKLYKHEIQHKCFNINECYIIIFWTTEAGLSKNLF